MTLSFKDWKLKLVEELLQLKEEQSLRKIEKEIKYLSETEKKAALRQKVYRPTRATISIEQMKKEQNYQPINKEDFYKKAAKLNIREPLEELLSMLD
ncbi:MAG: hypothetical protein AAGJ18_01970 [Bacteroidota bacterium]